MGGVENNMEHVPDGLDNPTGGALASRGSNPHAPTVKGE